MTVWYAGFCPMGDECSKGGKRICCCSTLEQTRSKISWHLQSSSYHSGISQEDADSMAGNAPIEEEIYEDTNDDRHSAQGKGKAADRGKGGKGWGKSSGNNNDYRAQPYQIVSPPPAAQSEHAGVIAAISRCESAARTAARMARSAALAFEEESSTMTSALQKLQGAR